MFHTYTIRFDVTENMLETKQGLKVTPNLKVKPKPIRIELSPNIWT